MRPRSRDPLSRRSSSSDPLVRLLCSAIALLAAFCLLSSRRARAEGGWVGNSPIKYAAWSPDVRLDEGSGWRAHASNALLPGPGTGNAGVEAFKGDRLSGLAFDLNYGLTERWALRRLSSLAYALNAQNGSGHEWAVVAGLVDGLSFGSGSGLRSHLGGGVVHTYRAYGQAWRLTNAVFAATPLAKDEPANVDLSAETALGFQLDDDWSAGMAVHVVPFADWLSVSAARKLAESSTVVASLGANPRAHGDVTRRVASLGMRVDF
jgi:hypothetical protein